MSGKKTVIISACLLGLKTRYDGKDALNENILEKYSGYNIIPVCPEQLGGLPTPRKRAEIKGGDGLDVLRGDARVIDATGTDVTGNFMRGAAETIKIARMFEAEEAVLKSKSPSCGVKTIMLGNEQVAGYGVTAALLREEGLKLEEA